jgi:trk system potassium uptake protein TrkA
VKNIVICGAGEVGHHAAEVIAELGHSVTIIDTNSKRLTAIEEQIDVRSLRGSSSHPQVLLDAEVDKADLLVAATNSDEINLLTAALGKHIGCERVIARVHNRAYIDSQSFDYCTHFNIDHLICPEQLTSRAIAASLSDPGVMEIKFFAANQIEMHKYVVQGNSAALGVKLCDLKLPAQVRVAVVEREGRYFIADGETAFHIEDKVTVIGKQEGFKEIQSLFHRNKVNPRIAIMGGASMGQWLAEDLAQKNFSIRLFETDQAIAVELSEKYSDLTVIASDPTDPDEFMAEQLAQCAAFITASDSDEQNILGALQAKKLGVPLTYAVIHKPHFLPILENIGIDYPMSPRVVAAESLLKFVVETGFREIASLAPKVADIFEIGPVTRGEAVVHSLRDLNLPNGAMIGAIHRGQEAWVPSATDIIETGDTVILIGPNKSKKSFRKMFLS